MGSGSDGPFLLDVHTVALAHGRGPHHEEALSYVRKGMRGDISTVVTMPTVVGAQHILHNFYNFSWNEAGRILLGFTRSSQVYWYEDLSVETVQEALQISREYGIEGWDAYTVAVARKEGYPTVVTTDNDFERAEGVSVECVLTPEEASELSEWYNAIRGDNRDSVGINDSSVDE
jgi:predicted nucleic acid-binding protein